MLNNSIRLFTIRGIEVGVHYSWLIIFGLMTWSLSTYVFPNDLRGQSAVTYWILGASTAILLFVSVLIHELAHSFVALARGLQARSITLFIFGGVSSLGGEAREASTEFLVAIVGPLTSFVLAGVAYIVATVVDEPRVDLVASYLVYINIVLGAFNLVPGFPLDGGRVLRSILWRATNNMRKATEWAANVGKVVAWGMFAYALFLVFDGQYIGGIWMAAIAWFLHNAASNSVQQLVFESRLKRVRAADVVRPDEPSVQPGLTVAELIDDYLLPTNRRAVAVTDNGRLVGIVTLSDILKVPAADRGRVTVAEVMGGRDGLHTIPADARVQDAVELLAEHDLEQLPVVDDGRFIGLLTRADVMRQLQLREALDVSS
ncbi:MAG: site-2 protease family protein [Chloroflexota bacterium]